MFYIAHVEDYVRVEPKFFGLETKDAVEKQLNTTYEDYTDKELGTVVIVVSVDEVGEGIIIPGDGAAYYNSRFKLLVYKPDLQELVFCNVLEITNFGAFMDMGVTKGMIHITQVMDDYVSFSKSGTLIAKSGKKSLKKGDACLARIVALSEKGSELKIGLTMRQPGLGRIDWIEAEKKKRKTAEKSEEKTEKAGKKEKKK
ncbi:DNA-directed RNA polymerase [Candidatus Woesearchaeota archaeon CG10_big_fil_rev_8_21_14_0_10_34_12]|nr:MAG: DNA-directed RNA polymerase [Candidatus Woesearchaeota archaeon CG10_big_fil_rev_8_21_14_0_10_34_12]